MRLSGRGELRKQGIGYRGILLGNEKFRKFRPGIGRSWIGRCVIVSARLVRSISTTRAYADSSVRGDFNLIRRRGQLQLQIDDCGLADGEIDSLTILWRKTLLLRLTRTLQAATVRFSIHLPHR